MRIEIDAGEFSAALSHVGRVAGRNLALPVLSCVLIEAHDNGALLRATNLEVGIEYNLSAKVSETGVAAVPAQVLMGVMASVARGSTITLSDDSGVVTVAGGGSTSKIKCFDHNEFPTIPRVEDGAQFAISAGDLVRGLRSVYFCASNSTIKPELASVYMYPNANNLTFVATDSFRLAEKAVPLKKPLVIDPILIPIRTVPEIIRVLENESEEVSVQVSEHQLALTAGPLYLTSRLTEGSFPDYRKIIPAEFTTEITLLKQDALHVLKKATVFLDRFSQITFTVDPKAGAFIVKAVNAEVGEMEDRPEAAVTGEPITISFNQRYVADSFQSIPVDSVSFSLAGTGRPMVIKGVSDTSFMYLVMPMNR